MDIHLSRGKPRLPSATFASEQTAGPDVITLNIRISLDKIMNTVCKLEQREPITANGTINLL
jgi:hypothetical protein